MDSNRFFRVVWRFNALLLALGGILIVGVVAWNAFRPSWQEPKPTGVFAPVPKSAEKDHTYRLEPLPLSLMREELFSLREWNGSPRSYGLAMQLQAARLMSTSYVSPDGVNLLAIDDASGQSHWLFHGYRRGVLSEEGVATTKAAFENAQPAATMLVILTVDSDTNKDGEFAEGDRQSLYFYRPGMTFAAKFLDVDRIIWRGEVEGGNYLVVYERGKSAVAATFGVPDFKLKSERMLPAVPN